MPAAKRPRRRRRPEEAEGEILHAARALLAELPSHEVTIGRLMAETTLSRKSFYVYFRDRYDLLRRLVEPLSAERDAIVARLFHGPADAAAGGPGVTSSSRSSRVTPTGSAPRSRPAGSGGSTPSRRRGRSSA